MRQSIEQLLEPGNTSVAKDLQTQVFAHGNDRSDGHDRQSPTERLLQQAPASVNDRLIATQIYDPCKNDNCTQRGGNVCDLVASLPARAMELASKTVRPQQSNTPL